MNKSITNKIMMFFLGIIFFVIFSIVMYCKSSLIKNTEYLINNEIKETTKSINLYLEQYFKYNRLDFNKVSFSAQCSNISKDLSYRLDKTVYMYNNNDKLVYPNINKKDEPKKTKDIDKAKIGKLSYTIEYKDNDAKVYVSYPILKENEYIGMIRYINDYSRIFKQNTLFINSILVFSIIIFILSIIVAYLISKQITKPIIDLANKTKEIANGNFDVEIEIDSKDELGKLSLDFKSMTEQIKNQIKTIEQDRDHLKEISEKQKRFFDNVTHELKTPMTTIIGYSEIIKDNQFTDEKFFNKGISRIISEATRLNRMIVQLLELSKNNNNDFDYELNKLNLSNILLNMCEDMTYKAKKYNMNIESDIQKNIKIIANEDKIKEIIINLIDNSIKYGRVNSIIYVKAYLDRDYVTIKVKDSGEGICKKELENILSPFYRVSKSETRELGSTGLGLAIVQSIVNNYNGQINIKSKINEGTEVIINLPTIN